MKKITRPWQATFLTLIAGFKMVANSLILLLLLFAREWFGTWLSQFNPEFIVISAIKPIIFLPLLGSIILAFFFMRGLWKGQKWAPITLVFLHGLALILMGLWAISDTRWAIPFAITLFIVALEIECWIHPFFKSKKTK